MAEAKLSIRGLGKTFVTDRGETVALNIATDQPVAEIDYAPLRAQFEIGGQSVRRSYALVNGQARRTSGRTSASKRCSGLASAALWRRLASAPW